jgi:AraC-like DNA-binding protein
MAAAPGHPHRLPDLARALGTSESHLAHVFREETGSPVHHHLLHLRLAVALERLAAGEMRLSALALDLGFSSHSHFTAAFRKWLGLTPAAARRYLVETPR